MKDKSTVNKELTTEALSKVKNGLKYGDRKVIANVVGCSPELVKKVLSGERKHRKGKGKLVVEVAQKIIDVRELLTQLKL